MTQYTGKSDELVFLNDKNIAQARGDIATVDYNAVPSLSLFNSTYDELTARDLNIELSADGISATVTDLCASLSNFMGKSYNALSLQTYVASTLLSTAVDSLSGAADFLSAEISGTATVFSNTTQLSNKVKVVEVTNAQYDALIATGKQEDTAIYVIEDSYYSARGCQMKNLAFPTELSDASNKAYVDQQAGAAAATAIATAESYADGISAEMSATTDVRIIEANTELSNTLSSYTNAEVGNLSTSLSTTVQNAGYALYSNFGFSYDSNNHKILLTLNDQLGHSRQLSVETSDFIKNRIIKHIDIVEVEGVKYMRIFWDNASGAEEHTDIKLSELAQVYTPGTGIAITLVGNSYQISVTDYVATKAALDDVAATAKTLSTTTYSELTGATDAVSKHTDQIQSYVNTLSAENPSGILYSMKTDIATLCTDITAVTEARLTGIESDVADVIAHAGRLQSYADQLSSAGGIIYSIGQQIDQLSTKTDTTLPNRIKVSEDDIVALKAHDVKLQWYADYLSGVSGSNGKINDLSNEIKAVDAKVDAKEPRLASVEAYVRQLSNESDTTPGIIKQINKNITDLQADLTGNIPGSTNVRLTNAEGDIVGLKAVDATQQAYLNALSSDHGHLYTLSNAIDTLTATTVPGIGTRIGAVEGRMTAAEGSISDTRATVNSLSSGSGPIPTLQTQYAALNAGLNAHTEAIETINVTDSNQNDRLDALETWKPTVTPEITAAVAAHADDVAGTSLGHIKTNYTTSGKNYKVQLDSSNNAYVNVPWTDTTYSSGAGLTLTGTTFKIKEAVANALKDITTTSELTAIANALTALYNALTS